MSYTTQSLTKLRKLDVMKQRLRPAQQAQDRVLSELISHNATLVKHMAVMQHIAAKQNSLLEEINVGLRMIADRP